MVNVDEMVDRAKAMYRAGRRAEARDLLLDAVRQDANHQDAWLWLSGMVSLAHNLDPEALASGSKDESTPERAR